MYILALETSGQVAGVAIASKDKIMAEFNMHTGLTHSETLMPMVERVFEISGIPKSGVQWIAISQGPGSFTGLRIGGATAKGIAKGLNLSLIPVPTLDQLAYNIRTDKIICSMMDARRNQVYTGFYRGGQHAPLLLTPYKALSVPTVLSLAQAYDEEIIFTGDGAYCYQEIILQASNRFSIAPPSVGYQRAGILASLAFQYLPQAVKPHELELLYLRKPQAEREWEERHGN